MVRYKMRNNGRLWKLVLVALALLPSCGGKSSTERYDTAGTWFSGYGASSDGKCFPMGLRTGEMKTNYWVVTRTGSVLEATDDGKCTVTLETGPNGVLVGDGQVCRLDPKGPLAAGGTKERRYLRFRLDPHNNYFGATFVDKQAVNGPELVVCGLLETSAEARPK